MKTLIRAAITTLFLAGTCSGPLFADGGEPVPLCYPKPCPAADAGFLFVSRGWPALPRLSTLFCSRWQWPFILICGNLSSYQENNILASWCINT